MFIKIHCLHCSRESIRLGEHNLDTVDDCEEYCTDPVQDYQVEKIVSHEKFDIHRLKNDIGLVRLKTKVPQYTGTYNTYNGTGLQM
jgi:hypothetical protein